MTPMAEIPEQLALGSRFRALSVALSPVAIPYDAGNTRASEVPKTYLTKDIFIRLTGSLTVGVAVATILDDAPLGLLSSIELAGDGNETLWKLAGRDAYRLSNLFNGKAGELVPPSGAVGTNAFSASLVLSAEAVNMAIPVDSYLDLREFEKTELRITWGAATEIATAGGGGSITITAATQIDAYANQSTEGLNSIGFRRFLSFDQRDINATNPELTVLVPRSGLLAGILFRSDRDKAKVDNIFNFITLTSDSSHDHFKRRSWASLQFENVIKYQLDGGAGGGSGRITGYAYLDLLEDGRLSSAINTEALNELKLSLDVTRTSGVEIIRMTYVFFKPLRRAVA